MKALKRSLFITSAIILLSCPSIQANGPAPLPIKGTYKHNGTDMVFPEAIGKFQRVQITQFAPAEKDVGVGYNLYDPPIAATIYVYPAPALISTGSPPDAVAKERTLLFQEHLDELKAEIMGAHPDATLISDDNVTLTMGKQSHKGRKVTFEFAYVFGEGPQTSISQLYLFQNRSWLIKYRITYPKATASASEAAVKDFLNTLVWPDDGKP